MRTTKAGPSAATLIESMRDIGYSLETAVADVIDNSITAGAKTIQLFAEGYDAGFRIGILDDGDGMTEAELLNAMRPGSRSPRETRSKTDLGRFGLGLKTASFSQCRRLTVLTRSEGSTSTACWDLDFVAEQDEWLVQHPEDLDCVPWSSRLGEHGTLIVWEKLDRVVEDCASKETYARFVNHLDRVWEHLALVYHRFLSGEPGLRKIRILLNERVVEPNDPFNVSHPATIAGPAETIKIRDYVVTIQPFTLPHHSKVKPGEWERLAGRDGYVKNQGFYVYRQKRLIIHGTWFGLARQTELTKLARVRIDMANGLDAEWKIDVRKASAQPPYQVRERLRRIIEEIGATSRRVYRGKGATLVSENRLPVWIRIQNKNEIHYRVNPEHPVLAEFIGRLPDDLARDFQRVVEIAGAALPMDALFADLGAEPSNVAGTPISDETLKHAVVTTFRQLSKAGIASDDVFDMMQAAEPFRSNWERTEAMLRLVTGEKASDV